MEKILTPQEQKDTPMVNKLEVKKDVGQIIAKEEILVKADTQRPPETGVNQLMKGENQDEKEPYERKNDRKFKLKGWEQKKKDAKDEKFRAYFANKK